MGIIMVGVTSSYIFLVELALSAHTPIFDFSETHYSTHTHSHISPGARLKEKKEKKKFKNF